MPHSPPRPRTAGTAAVMASPPHPPPPESDAGGHPAPRRALAGGGRAEHGYAALLERVASATRDDLGAVLAALDGGEAPAAATLHPARAAAARALRRRPGVPPGLQLSAQVGATVAICSVFVLVEAVSFRGGCLSATYAVVVAVMASPTAHVGARLRAAASVPVPLLVGAAAAGGAASAASAVGGSGAAYTAVLASLCLAPLALAASVRVLQSPPYAIGMGLLLALSTGSTAITAAAARFRGASPHAHWAAVVRPFLEAGSVAILAVVVSTFAVLPSTAASAIEAAAAAAARGAAAALSATASRLFAPAVAPIPPAAAAAALPPVRVAPHVYVRREPQEGAGFAAWWDAVCSPPDAPAGGGGGGGDASADLRRLVSSVAPKERGKKGDDSRAPSHPPSPPPVHLTCLAPAPPAASMRPLLAAARAALAAAACEPPVLRWRARPFDPAAWGALLAALDILVTRAATLDTAASLAVGYLGDGGDAGRGTDGRSWHPAARRAVRLAFARAAASLAALSAVAGGGEPGPGFGDARAAHGQDWRAAADSVRAGLRAQVDAYVAAIAGHGSSTAEAGNGAAGRGGAGGDADHGPESPRSIVLPSAYAARVRFFTSLLAVSVVDAMHSVDAAAAAVLGAAPARPHPLGWVRALAGVAVCEPALRDAAASLRRPGAACACAAPGSDARTAARVRTAGIKYWALASTLLAATLATSKWRVGLGGFMVFFRPSRPPSPPPFQSPPCHPPPASSPCTALSLARCACRRKWKRPRLRWEGGGEAGGGPRARAPPAPPPTAFPPPPP